MYFLWFAALKTRTARERSIVVLALPSFPNLLNDVAVSGKWALKIKTSKFINWSPSPTPVVSVAVAKWPAEMLIFAAVPSWVGRGGWGRGLGTGCPEIF